MDLFTHIDGVRMRRPFETSGSSWRRTRRSQTLLRPQNGRAVSMRGLSNLRNKPNRVVEWQRFHFERGEFFSALLKFSQYQAKFLLSNGVNV
jgi:hypothetical protein